VGGGLPEISTQWISLKSVNFVSGVLGEKARSKKGGVIASDEGVK
jgi:hypothetical protein